jgi:hypothetical protein
MRTVMMVKSPGGAHLLFFLVRPKTGPREPQDRPKTAPDRPQKWPRAAKGRPKSSPRAAKTWLREAQTGHRPATDRPKSGPDSHQTCQEPAKTGPRPAQTGPDRPRAAQDRPKSPEQRPRGDPKSRQEQQESLFFDGFRCSSCHSRFLLRRTALRPASSTPRPAQSGPRSAKEAECAGTKQIPPAGGIASQDSRPQFPD